MKFLYPVYLTLFISLTACTKPNPYMQLLGLKANVQTANWPQQLMFPCYREGQLVVEKTHLICEQVMSEGQYQCQVIEPEAGTSLRCVSEQIFTYQDAEEMVPSDWALDDGRMTWKTANGEPFNFTTPPHIRMAPDPNEEIAAVLVFLQIPK